MPRAVHRHGRWVTKRASLEDAAHERAARGGAQGRDGKSRTNRKTKRESGADERASLVLARARHRRFKDVTWLKRRVTRRG
jgi:hypothetical protein